MHGLQHGLNPTRSVALRALVVISNHFSSLLLVLDPRTQQSACLVPLAVLSVCRLQLQGMQRQLQSLAARIPGGANATLPPDACGSLLTSAQGLTQQLSKLLEEQKK